MENNKKICPLLSIGRTTDPTLCLGEHCAWQDQLTSICCIAAVTDSIQNLADRLDVIGMSLEKMEDT